MIHYLARGRTVLTNTPIWAISPRSERKPKSFGALVENYRRPGCALLTRPGRKVSTNAAAPQADDHFLRRASDIVTARAAGGMAVRPIRSRMGVEEDLAGIAQLTADHDLVRAETYLVLVLPVDPVA